MSNETEYFCQNITFTSTLSRPSSTKGSVLSADGAGVFGLTAPSADNQILSSLSTETYGVSWATSTDIVSFGFPMPNAVFPAEGNSSYFLVMSDNSNPDGLDLPTVRAVFFSLRPDGQNGWANPVTGITGGTIDFTLGYVNADTQQSVANFNAYSGAPHFQINGTDINTAGNRNRSFTTTLDIAITSGQQVSMLITNNLTSTGGPTYTAQVNPFIIFRS